MGKDWRNYAVAILGVSTLVFGVLYFKYPKVVEKTVTKTEVKVEKVFVKSDSTVTGGTTATTHPDGSVSVSGENITVVSHTTSTTTITDKQIEKEYVKYSYNLLEFGGQVNLSGDYGVHGTAKLDNFIVGLDYCLNRQVWGIRAGVIILAW